jgi:hypothetical protein
MNTTLMLGAAALAALLLKSTGSTKQAEVIPFPGGKPKAKATPKKKSATKSTPHALVLTPSLPALPADTHSLAQRAADQPVPADMQPSAADAPIVDMGQSEASEPASTKPLTPPKKPKAPKKRGARPPTAAKLAKPAKRTGKQAASDLRDYLDGGGNPGSRASRSDFVRAAQHDMGGLQADGVYGTKTRARAKSLGVDIQH